jgi:hypothetical protein
MKIAPAANAQLARLPAPSIDVLETALRIA